MTRTSRRNFGKLMAGAMATVPIASLVESNDVLAQSKAKSDEVLREDIRYHENTPPPIEMLDGSFFFVIKTPNATKPLDESGSGPFVYKGKIAGSSDNNIEHIKILHGSGEWIYRDLEAVGSTITIELQDYDNGRSGTLTVSGDGPAFQVVSQGYGPGNANGKLNWTHDSGRPHHKHKFSHQGGPGNKDFRITSIKITKGGPTTLNFVLPAVSSSAPFESQEYRILIWLRD